MGPPPLPLSLSYSWRQRAENPEQRNWDKQKATFSLGLTLKLLWSPEGVPTRERGSAASEPAGLPALSAHEAGGSLEECSVSAGQAQSPASP